MPSTTLIDMTGKKLGKWTVISKAPYKKHWKNKSAQWNVICECGTKTVIAGTELRKKRPSMSCGCVQKGSHPERIGKYSREKHHAWKGGRHFSPTGYIYISRSQVVDWYPNAVLGGRRKMLEHRAVMSNHLKRALFSDETIHHKNGDRSDNRIENLELRAGKHGPGQSVEDLTSWAKEILARYS